MTKTEFQNKLIDLYDSLMRYAYSLSTDWDLARDLVQETCLKALKNSDKYGNDYSLRAWTFTILKNTYINEYRRQSYQNNYPKRTNGSFIFDESRINGAEDPASILLTIELTNSIDKLNDTLRVPLMMRIKGYKYKEIADELNLNIGTVKSRIFWSRKQLTTLIES